MGIACPFVCDIPFSLTSVLKGLGGSRLEGVSSAPPPAVISKLQLLDWGTLLIFDSVITNHCYLVSNGNNMQSVKTTNLSDSLENSSNKGIYSYCLISNVSVIICVPSRIKNNCYSNINTVTEPMQCIYATVPEMVITNNFGAFKRVDKNKSQRYSIKMLDKDIYYKILEHSIQNNQIGDTPNCCIPVTIHAITVQGISYSDPYFISFNFISKMALEAPESKNKSDYAFKTSVGIIDKMSNEMTKQEIMSQNSTTYSLKEITEYSSQYMLPNVIQTIPDNNRNINENKGIESQPIIKPVCKNYSAASLNRELTLNEMIRLSQEEKNIMKDLKTIEPVNSWGVPKRLRMCGGGESSLNTASGWGSPPASNNNAGNWGNSASSQSANSGQQQWNNSAQRPPTSQADLNSNKNSTNQMPPTSSTSGQNWQGPAASIPGQGNNNAPPQGSNGTPNAGNGNNGGNNSPNSASSLTGNGTNGNNSMSSTNKIEQLNSMRESLYSQDGWGGQHVNQDTNWEVPGSPEPGIKNEPVAAGPVPGAPAAWKPNANSGAFLGTELWEANLRNGGQPPPQPATKTPWGHTPTTNIGGTWGEDDDAADSSNMWAGQAPPQQWGAAPPHQPQQWPVNKKDDWGAWGEAPRGADPRIDPHRGPDPRQMPPDPRHGDLRGDLRGISGRLNGDMWSQHHAHPPQPNKMMPAAVNQWPPQGLKDGVKGTGWEEPSPPAARRTTGFEDGTSLWAQRGGAGALAAGRGVGQPGGPPQRGPPVPGKPEAVWGSHPHRNGSWEEPHTPAWPEREAPTWPDAGPPNMSWPGSKAKPPSGAWPDDIGEWGTAKGVGVGPGKQVPKEVLWGSKQFRALVEMGFKKEEVETALRSRDMNAEDALEMLMALRAGGGGGEWGAGRGARDQDHFGGGFAGSGGLPVSHKLLSQPPPHHHGYAPPAPPPAQPPPAAPQPSTAQLRMLVQQIQMAVSAGYLNHQILNQPLAPQTLVLLNQLLQQIKVLQGLMGQHSLALSKANSTLVMHCQVQIQKAKHQISTLQNQIAAQQAIYVKQQQGGGADLFKQTQDPLAQLQNNFTDMSIAKDPQPNYGGGGGGGNQQSRLNQWKLPALDKEVEREGNEFSRAPGTAKCATSPPLNALSLQPDTTWGVGVGGAREGWGEPAADVADGKDWPAHQHNHQPVYDLVPEFEPGKPWKGNQMKNVEDDPAITPGSVVRSPLSLAAIKDTEMLSGKTSPAGERSLSSATWSYGAPASTPTTAGKASEPWATTKGEPWGGKARAPLGKPAWPHHNVQGPRAAAPHWHSTWLLLKNLTAQIDGSTLKTLCMQHGPLQNFHLYLNQGIALARYSTREEAAKAQTALNNCVLSNTTIFAESPADSEVQMILQHLGSGGGVGVGGGVGGVGAGAWRGKDSASWGFPSLWSSDTHDQRSTPSNLNSFLPPDLLGGESI